MKPVTKGTVKPEQICPASCLKAQCTDNFVDIDFVTKLSEKIIREITHDSTPHSLSSSFSGSIGFWRTIHQVRTDSIANSVKTSCFAQQGSIPKICGTLAAPLFLPVFCTFSWGFVSYRGVKMPFFEVDPL